MYEDFEKRKKEIEDWFDSQKKTELERLKTQQLSAEEKAKSQAELLDKRYAAEGNDLAVQYERNRRNFNTQAAARGLNSGTASQAQLAHNAMYLKEFGAHSAARSSARERGLAALRELNLSFQQKASETAGDYDRRKAESIFSEREKQTQKMLTQAQNLAKYGDFSLYAKLYGPEQAKNMETMWLRQNPNLAFAMGKITAEEFFKLTGRYAPGHEPEKRRGGGGWGRIKKKDEEAPPLGTAQGFVDARHPGLSHRGIYEY